MKRNAHTVETVAFFSVMAVFGTVGIVKRYIPLGGGTVALVRALIGVIFLGAFLLLSRRKVDVAQIKHALPLLLLSGVALGFNWIFLFEAYRYTTVAIATVSYYTAPLFFLIGSALFFRERLPRTILVTFPIALVGVLLVSGIFEPQAAGSDHLIGVLLGLFAAVLYAFVVLVNRRLRVLATEVRTLCQMATAALAMLPYVLLLEDVTAPFSLTALPLFLLLLLGVLHTGIAYLVYFRSVGQLSPATVAVGSYLDPVLAVLLSILIGERLTLLASFGVVLVLGAMIAEEVLPLRKRHKEAKTPR